MKDKLGGKIMTKCFGLRSLLINLDQEKDYSYLIDNVSEDKISKRHKNVCHKKKT